MLKHGDDTTSLRFDEVGQKVDQNNFSGAKLSISSTVDFSKGSTFCVRTLFRVWNDRCVVETASTAILLSVYTKRMGSFIVDDKTIYFNWDQGYKTFLLVS
jgi:hypothetical protein